MRLTKASWLLLLLLYIFPSLLHCPWCLSHFVERSATIPSSDSPMIDLEQGHDYPVNKVGPVSPQGFAVASSPLPDPHSPHELGSLPRLEDQSPYHAPQLQNKSSYKNTISPETVSLFAAS